MENKIIRLSFSSQLENLPIIAQTIKEHCSYFVKDTWLLYQLELCVVEVISNIIIHAYKERTDQRIEIEMNLSPSCVEFTFYDSGIKHDYPIRKPSEINPKDIFSYPESGRGLELIHQFMDEVKMEIKQGKNMTLIKKRLI